MLTMMDMVSISYTSHGVMSNVCMHAPPKAPKRKEQPYIYGVTGSADGSFQSHRATTQTLSFSKMCSGTWNTKIQCSSPAVFIRQQQQKKKPRVSVMSLRRKRLRLIRRRRAAGAELGMMNLKLHLDNQRLMAENEKLRERAGVLRRENLALQASLSKTVAALKLGLTEVAPGC